MSAVVSVVIPVYRQLELLDRCLASLQAIPSPKLEVIVVDDQSPDDPEPITRKYPGVLLLRQERNSGYAAANNRGLEASQGDFLLFLNSDTEVTEEALRVLMMHLAEQLEVGGVTPLHREPDGTFQRTCFRFPDLRFAWFWHSPRHLRQPDHPIVREYEMREWDHLSPRRVEHAQTSCLLIRREVYDRIGGMDPNLFLFYNDTDFCLRMSRAGYPIDFLPQAVILHHGGASVNASDQAEARIYGDRYRYFRKWYGFHGAMAVRCSLWSRIVYEMLVELAHGDLGFAMRKFRRGWTLHRAMRPRVGPPVGAGS